MDTDPRLMTRQQFMKVIEARSLKEPELMRLPFVYTALDGASISQAQSAWEARFGKKSLSVIKSLLSTGSI